MSILRSTVAGLFCFVVACQSAGETGGDGWGEDLGKSDGTGDTGGEGSGDTGGVGPEYQSGSRIRARTLSTPDGARQFLGWWDMELGIACGFSDSGDGITRCLPQDVMWAFYDYADAGCTQLLASRTSCAEPVPPFIVVSELACQIYVPQHYYETGTEFTAATIYSRYAAGECKPRNRAEGQSYYRAGAEQPLSSFQTMTESVE